MSNVLCIKSKHNDMAGNSIRTSQLKQILRLFSQGVPIKGIARETVQLHPHILAIFVACHRLTI